MTLQEFQNIVHKLYMGNTDTPDSNTDSWALRLGFLETSINMWEHEEGVEWDELWVRLTNASDGDKTTDGSHSTLDTPTDFQKPGGFLYLTDSAGQKTWYKFKKPGAVQLEQIQASSEKYFWVTGNKKVGFTINLSDTPVAGLTVEYPYYKDAFIPALTTDVLEMSGPFFAVHFTLANLQALSENGDKASLSLSMANQKLKSMKVKNAASPAAQEDAAQDYGFSTGTGGFGN